MIRICVLGYSRLTEIAQRVVRSLSYDDTLVEVVDSNVDTIAKCVNDAFARNVDVFVGGGANAAEFNRLFKGHLTEIKISDLDYLSAIRKAQNLDERIAICCYKYSRIPSVRVYQDILGMEIELLIYEDTDEMQSLIASSQARVVIGASHSVEVAERLNKRTVLIYPGDRNILSAIEKARQTAIDLQKDQRLQAISRAIVNNASVGIIVSDETDQIILFNRTAQNITNISGSDARGRTMDELFPNFDTAKFFASSLKRQQNNHLVDSQVMSCMQTKIITGEIPIGVLTTFGTTSRRKKATEISPRQFAARHCFENFISASPTMQTVLSEAKLYARTDDPLMILGEPGTERERLAQCIHNESEFSTGPYVRINLAAIPPVEAGRCLFGLRMESTQVGVLKLADGGTIVLENVGAAFPQTLACIEEYLKYQNVIRPDESDAFPVRARTISILTQREIDTLDLGLLHKLNVLRINMPVISLRREDVPEIFQRIMGEQGHSYKDRNNPGFADILRHYSWPGNTDEIHSVCRRYTFAMSQISRPSASVRRLLLLDAIGKDKVFTEIQNLYQINKNPSEEDMPRFLKGIGVMKTILGYNNQTLAEKLGISRTSLWRLAKR